MRDAVVVEAVRTPIGRRKGSLADIHPVDLSATVLNSLIERTGLAPDVVDDVVWGCVGQVGEQAGNIARNTVLAAGWPERVPSTLDYTTTRDGAWHRPRWTQAWFPDAFAGTMAGLLRAIERGEAPDISGRDNLRTIALCEAVLTAATEHRVVPGPAESTPMTG